MHIEQKLKAGLKRGDNILERALLSWGTTPNVHVVRGKPWLEDLNRFPALRLKVNLSGGDLSEESLWALLRPYGRIASIDKKPGEAMVLYSRMRSATAARNCAHGLVLPDGTKLVINYAGLERTRKLWDWVTNHPRIVLPILAVLLGGFTYAIFDPIRAFFIETKLSHTFDLGNYRLYAWLKKNTVDLLIDSDDKDAKSDSVDWFERRAARESIQDWLKEKPETFITIVGPRGSGKHKLLESALPKGVKSLTIDCAEIAKSVGGAAASTSSSSKTSASDGAGGGKTDAALISALAAETGYWPVFGWLNSLNSIIDLAAVGIIGSKAGFSKPVEEQLSQVLGVTSKALASAAAKDVKKAEQERKKREKASQKASPAAPSSSTLATVPSHLQAHLPSGSSPADEKSSNDAINSSEHLENTAQTKEAPPTFRAQAPVVIIDNFHLKSLRSPLLYEVLTSWASSLVSSGTAHVIFVSDNAVAMSKELGRALPDSQPANNVVLADAEQSRAREFVRSRLRESRGTGTPTNSKPVAPVPEPPAQGSSSTPVTSPDAVSGQIVASLRSPHLFRAASPTPEPALTSSATTSKNDKGVIVSPDSDSDVLPESDARWVDKLGGRLTDLENLLAKISIGQSVPTAVSEIISRTIVELRKSFFGDDATESSSLPWTRSNAWAVIRLLTESEDGSVPYHWLLHSDSGAFKGDEAKLRAMEEAELLSVRHKDGRPSTVRAGRPVLLEAMRELVAQDETFRLTQNLLDAKASLAKTETGVRALEDELKGLIELSKLKGVATRMDALSKKLESEQDKARSLEDKLAEMEAKLRKLE